jgi:hypothetical protein
MKMRRVLLLGWLAAFANVSACSPPRQSSAVPRSTTTETAQSKSGTVVTIKESILQYANQEYTIVDRQPSVFGLKNAAVQRDINRRLVSLVQARIANFANMPPETDPVFFSGGRKWSQEIRYYPVLISPSIISLYFVETLDEGGTHPNETTFSFSYSILDHSELTLSDLVSSGHLGMMSEVVIARLIGNLKASKEDDPTREKWIRQGASPQPAHYKTFAIGADGLHFYFDPYQVAPHSEGIQEILIDPHSIKDALNSIGQRLLLTNIGRQEQY